jgi:proline dehydrogenase
MLHSASKAFFHLLARSDPLKALASRYGMRHPSSFARRFIAGESVTSLAAADAATRDYLRIIDAIVASGIGRNLSLKLTQLGLDVDRASAIDNLRKIFDRAEGFFVRIDMESSAYTDITLDIFETLWNHGYRNMGVVLQSELYRSEQDARRVISLGARVRLVKGAYREPKSVAYQKKADVDAAYVRLLKLLMSEGHYPAIATHDPAMIGIARDYAAQHRIASDRFEFQMLYGIRRDLQQALVADGYRVRVYIPFGREWFPYFMRRLGERPANIGFVLRSLVSERS